MKELHLLVRNHNQVVLIDETHMDKYHHIVLELGAELGMRLSWISGFMKESLLVFALEEMSYFMTHKVVLLEL
jgi:hypothetical protein